MQKAKLFVMKTLLATISVMVFVVTVRVEARSMNPASNVVTDQSAQILAYLPAGYYQMTPDGRSLTITNGKREFNRGIKRGEAVTVSGDRPRFALITYIPKQGTVEPNFAKMGDLRLRIRIEQKEMWLDEMENISARLNPGSSQYECTSKQFPGFMFKLTVAQAGDWGYTALLRVENQSTAPIALQAEFSYGGVAVHGRVLTPSYFTKPIDKDGDGDKISADHQKLTITDDSVPFIATAVSLPRVQPVTNDSRAVFPHQMQLEPGKSAQVAFICGFSKKEDGPNPNVLNGNPEKLAVETNAYYDKLLGDYAILTPSKVLNDGFIQAILNLDYDYSDPTWLESVQWWATRFPNNYQLMAAVALGQFDRSKKCLRFFGLTPPNQDWRYYSTLLADGEAGSRVFDKADLLLYYIFNLSQYFDATGDRALLESVWPQLSRGLNEVYKNRDPDGDGLISWHFGCNMFLYQADDLSLPHSAFSPSVFTAAMCEKLANLARILGKQEEAMRLELRARKTYAACLEKLWNSEEGAFYSHIDFQEIKHTSHYYTDFVFPTLYSSLDPIYGWHSLECLKRSLLLKGIDGQLRLMRVGNLKPPRFGNDNVMPTQMSEAACALFRINDCQQAVCLLEGVALAATVFTDGPGAFPERMTDDGCGQANYIFGPPTGIFLYGVVGGLFGVSMCDGGDTIVWNPSIPVSWPQASLRTPVAKVSYCAQPEDDGAIQTYRLECPRSRKLLFSVCLPLCSINEVTVDGKQTRYRTKAGLDGVILELDAVPSREHTIVIRYKTLKLEIKGPAVAIPGQSVKWSLPSDKARLIISPHKTLLDSQLKGKSLQATVAGQLGPQEFFVEFPDIPAIRKISFEVRSPYEIKIAKAVFDTSRQEASIHASVQVAAGLPADAQLRLSILGRSASQPLSVPELTSTSLELKIADLPQLAYSVYPMTVEILSGKKTLFRNVLTVSMEGVNPEATSAMQCLRDKNTRVLDLTKLINAEGLPLLSIGSGICPKIDRAKYPEGFKSPWGTFTFSRTGNFMAMISCGSSDTNTGLKVPGNDKPHSLTLAATGKTTMLTLVYANEVEPRHTKAMVGRIVLNYRQGQPDIVPLTAGRNIDHQFTPFATEAESLRVEYEQFGNLAIKVLRLPCDSTRDMESVSIESQAQDFSLGLIAAHQLMAN